MLSSCDFLPPKYRAGGLCSCFSIFQVLVVSKVALLEPEYLLKLILQCFF